MVFGYSGDIRVLLTQAVLGYSVTWKGCQDRAMKPMDRRSDGIAAHAQLERYGRSIACLRCWRHRSRVRSMFFAIACARTDLLKDVDAHAFAHICKAR